MPTPLKPTSSSASKTPHIAAPLLPSPPLSIRGAGSTNSGGGGPLIATTSFTSKPIDPSGMKCHAVAYVLCNGLSAFPFLQKSCKIEKN